MSVDNQHPAESNASIAVIGAGNIGSKLVGHLARCQGIGRILIIDPDTVSAGNTISQEFSRSDVGQCKAIALARRARKLGGGRSLTVQPIVARIEDVPWGLLRAADVLLGCVDSRLGRAAINLISWRVNRPWTDAGINAGGALARVQTHVPGGPDASCLECAWSARDRELLRESYSCDGRLKEPAPTGASSSLGGLAAALQAIECENLLRGSIEQSLNGKQLIIDARFHQYFVNTLRRNSFCAFDHKIWSIEKDAASVRTVRDLVDHGRQLLGGELPAGIGAGERKSWVTRLACRDCGGQARAFRLQGRPGPKHRRCLQCAGEMQPIGFYLRPRIDVRTAKDWLLDRPLCKFGLRSGDVLTLHGEQGNRHVEIRLAEEPGEH